MVLCLPNRLMMLHACLFLPLQSRTFSAQPLPEEDQEQSIQDTLEDTLKSKPAPHPSATAAQQAPAFYLFQPAYTREYVESITPTHKAPKAFHEYTGYYAVQALRRSFDFVTGYGSEMNEKKWLRRMVFLETVAGVPGMVAGAWRHTRSLSTMQRDKGWVRTLLEEAENERMVSCGFGLH
jgi:hypothetical protein